MTALAWASLAFIAYTYAGYALLLKVLPGEPSPTAPLPGRGAVGEGSPATTPSPSLERRGASGIHAEPLALATPAPSGLGAGREIGDGDLPTISVLLAICNEAANIGRKLDNVAAMDYPAGRVEVLVGSDGSTDETDAIVRRHVAANIRLFAYERTGKIGVLNRLVPNATGDILVFMDARQRVDLDALRRFAGHFGDSTVGAVGAELVITDEQGNETSRGVGVYWKFEKWLRRRESDLHLLTGLSGALYAMRRDLFVAPSDDMILDDVMIPLAPARRGYRLVIDETIRMYDHVADEDREFRRKVRTLLGNWQMFGAILKRPRPFPPRLVFSIVSHKLCRLLTPIAMIVLLVASALMPAGPARTILLAAQGAVYGLAVVSFASGGRLKNPLLSVCSTFCLLNAAAFMAMLRYATGRYRTAWK